MAIKGEIMLGFRINQTATTATKAVKAAAQPKGGYISPNLMKCTDYRDESYRNSIIGRMWKESVSPATVGVTVDYLTRFVLEKKITYADRDEQPYMDCFRICSHGIRTGKEYNLGKEQFSDLACLVDTELSDCAINSMCKLTAYDAMYRSGYYVNPDDINADDFTCGQIRAMVNTATEMLTDGISDSELKNRICFGPTFEGGMPKNIRAADADYICDNTLVDMKVSKTEKPDKTQTLQLAVYYIMGKHAVVGDGFPPIHNLYKSWFEDMDSIAIINPRSGMKWTLDMSEVSDETIIAIENEVMGGY